MKSIPKVEKKKKKELDECVRLMSRRLSTRAYIARGAIIGDEFVHEWPVEFSSNELVGLLVSRMTSCEMIMLFA